MWTPPRDVPVPPPPRRKIALGVLVALLAAVAVAVFVLPAIERSQEERTAAERRRDAAFEAAKRARLAREGRPRAGRAKSPPAGLSQAGRVRARRRLVGDLERAITRDARARVRAGTLDGPVIATRCEINPPSERRVERDPRARGSEYECLAITSRDPEGRFEVGHSFEARVDYRRFTFRWARVCRPPGEGAARLSC